MNESLHHSLEPETSREFEAAYKEFTGVETMLAVYIELNQPDEILEQIHSDAKEMRRTLSEEKIESYYFIAGLRFNAFLSHIDTDIEFFDLITETTEIVKDRASLPEEASMHMPEKFQELHQRGVLSDKQWRKLRFLYYGYESGN